MAKPRRWVVIVFGVFIVVVFVGIGAIIAVTAWFQQNLEVKQLTASEAETEFETIRQRFAGRPPLLEMRNGRPAYSVERAALPPSGARLQTLHVLAFERDEQHLARISLPFWLLRMKSDPIRFGSYASGLDDEGVDLRPEDVEKYGPGIILDTVTPDGERFMLWAE
jgi:hypothetical protein